MTSEEPPEEMWRCPQCEEVDERTQMRKIARSRFALYQGKLRLPFPNIFFDIDFIYVYIYLSISADAYLLCFHVRYP